MGVGGIKDFFDFGFGNFFHWVERCPNFVLLGMVLPSPLHNHAEVLAKRVNSRSANSVEATGSLIGSFFELAAGVKFGHGDFEGRDTRHVEIGGDPTAVVGNGGVTVFRESGV